MRCHDFFDPKLIVVSATCVSRRWVKVPQARLNPPKPGQNRDPGAPESTPVIPARRDLLAESSNEDLPTEGCDSFVASTTAPKATGWRDPSPGGNLARRRGTPFHHAPRNAGSLRKKYSMPNCHSTIDIRHLS